MDFLDSRTLQNVALQTIKNSFHLHHKSLIPIFHIQNYNKHTFPKWQID